MVAGRLKPSRGDSEKCEKHNYLDDPFSKQASRRRKIIMRKEVLMFSG